MSDATWFIIAIISILGLSFAGLAMEQQYDKSQCHIAAIQKGMPADEIVKVCGK